ncbi:MAG: Crp/Fnr family transcriptional regulator [Janthinobacterium lividum]
MHLPAPEVGLNTLINVLSSPAHALINSLLEPVELPLMHKLAEAGKPSPWMFFPTSGVASVIGRGAGNWQEIGVFGREGAGCFSPLLGSDQSPYTIFMQLPGRGFRIAADDLLVASAHSAELRTLLLRYVQTFITQVSQSALANAQFNIGQRLARWILMIHDRVGGDYVTLTHEFLAGMLGVGRTGITLALHELERLGTISMARKRINILDRSKLETMTSSYYGFAEAEYHRLIGQPLSCREPFGSKV